MARKPRIQFPGAFYHVVSRGDRREPIVRDDRDREMFLTILGDACGKTEWRVLALCLLPNHFHLVLETPEANLVAGMKWFLGTFTIRFNRRHQLNGHLFSGRYKALIVDGRGRGYLRTVCDYVHLNPARALLVPRDQALRTYRWSSWPEYLKPPGQRWPWLRVDRLWGAYGLAKESMGARRQFERALELQRLRENVADYRDLRRGWFFGDEAHKQALLARTARLAGPPHDGEAAPELAEARAEARAEAVVAEELRLRGWTAPLLAGLRKGDPEKVAIARRLRRETTMTLAWIAERLQMGTQTHLAHLLYWSGREGQTNDTGQRARAR